MANYCNYLIRAKGKKKAALMAFASTPKAGDFDRIVKEFGTYDEYVVWYQGECKWSLDAYSSNIPGVEIDLDNLSEEEIRKSSDYWDMTMAQRSKVLELDLFAHEWSEESEFNEFNPWENGFSSYNSKGEFYDLKVAEGISVDD